MKIRRAHSITASFAWPLTGPVGDLTQSNDKGTVVLAGEAFVSAAASNLTALKTRLLRYHPRWRPPPDGVGLLAILNRFISIGKMTDFD
jgi:hypothetical protein